MKSIPNLVLCGERLVNGFLQQAAVLSLLLSVALLAGGCATMGKPRPIEDAEWMRQALSQTRDDLTVWIVLPGNEQTEKHFGIPLQKVRIQPVWLRVANHSTRPYWLLPAFTDPAYFSSAEVTHRFRGILTSANNERRQEIRVEEVAFDQYIPPASDQSGFIYTVLHEGSQVYSIALLSTGSLQRFNFLIPTKRLRTDHGHLTASWRVDSNNITSGDAIDPTDLDILRRNLESLPAHTRNAASTAAGDPINFFIIARWSTLFPALISVGWDETEMLDTHTALRTTGAFIFRTDYRHSPVSPLFVLGRRQDAAFQKVRENINTRNHLRLWLMPMTFGGQPVWAGQISRDIGVRLTTRTPWLTTHEIDPDVDGARWNLVQDLIKAQCIAQIGFVEGGTSATPLAPRRNLTGDKYFTDGLRVVLFLSATPLGADEIQVLPWFYPPHGGLSQPGDYLKSFKDDPTEP
ncbi:MAG: LssY C-terminal domain-containing protein [Kiritimatiellae bacterium]|nr:LssY C-terminal domain-containing protein [Verrucomicrobiota bacterium]MBU4290735.1 LssY C-terminal domain-containing protein [Verrucomicrobiota bacterium]MCG2679753.1 LssY C-terminal domain-containing protein [Kiritimatiellia bacterium]